MMKKTDVLIVGQGLAGTWLSWYLTQAGLSFKMIDRADRNGASMRAAGLINPLTGRRLVTTWMIDQLMPFAKRAYKEIGIFLNQQVIIETSVIDFFPSVQMLQAFEKRYDEDPEYLLRGLDKEKYAGWFRYDLGWGAIHPCLQINVEKLLILWRSFLNKKSLLSEEEFQLQKLSVLSSGVAYHDLHARYIIFCDGQASAENPYFEKLPFALNKGEGMLVEINGLPGGEVYKKGMSLVPYEEGVFWLGSSYEWSFENNLPSEQFRKNAQGWLNYNLKLPHKILEHFAAVRPATLERRPFAGFHPQVPAIGILNGLGTKGCSLAPYFAQELVNKISGQGFLNPHADISRFAKILS